MNSSTISPRSALQQSRNNLHSRWKGTGMSACERISQKICVPVGRQTFKAGANTSFFTIGSCFARNVEERLDLAGANVLSRHADIEGLGNKTARPMGVFNKYTPYSILQELQFASGELTFPEDALLPLANGSKYDAQLKGKSGEGDTETLMKRRVKIQAFFKQAFQADVLILTSGLIEAWFDTKTGLYLNDTPAPNLILSDEERFQFKCLSVSECRKVLHDIHALLQRHSKSDQKLIITVSPVPINRTFTTDDIIVANTTSKSTLRAAATEFISSVQGVDYFPSYEAVLISHPDLAWQQDRLHVSDFIVGRIIGAFLQRYGVTESSGDGDLQIDHSPTPDERIIQQLNREITRYKKKIILLEAKKQGR